MIDFSKYKLTEAIHAQSGGPNRSLEVSSKGSELATDGGTIAKKDAMSGSANQRSFRSQKARKSQMGNTMENYKSIRSQKEFHRALDAQKSDWRADLQEKVVDGVEREQHPYVTVMPTGDENLIQAVKQMAGEVKGKKDKVKAGMQEEDTELDIETLIEAKKKKDCKDGYKWDSDKEKCVKKEKKSSSRTTIIWGGRWGHGGGKDDDDDDDNGSDDGGGDDGGGDGGGVSEMFDHLGTLLEMDLDTYRKHAKAQGKDKPKPFDPEARKKQRTSQIKSMRGNDTRTKTEKETEGRYK